MLLNEGWFSKGTEIPDEMIDSYLNDYLVFNYMRLYGIFNNDHVESYKHLLRDLYTLNTFKELDKQVNEFVNKKDKPMSKESTISVLNRICHKFGIPNEVLDNAVKDFKETELNEVNEASIEKNPYPAGSLQANLWRPSEDNINEENEDWMILWKQHQQQESTTDYNNKLSESTLAKKDESLLKYLNRMKNLFIDN